MGEAHNSHSIECCTKASHSVDKEVPISTMSSIAFKRSKNGKPNKIKAICKEHSVQTKTRIVTSKIETSSSQQQLLGKTSRII